MWIFEYVKNRIDTCEKCFFRFEKGYKRINVQDSLKTYCYYGVLQKIFQKMYVVKAA